MFLSIIPVQFSKWQDQVLTDFLKNQKYYSKIINNRDDLLSFLKNIPEDMSAKTYQIFIDFLRDQQDISGNINNIESLNLFIASIPESISEEKYQILIDFLKDQQDISEVIKCGSDLKSFLKNIPSNISTNKYQILIDFLEKQRHFLEIINNNENFNLFIENLQEDKHQSTIEKIRRMQCFPTELFILYDIRSEANDPHWKKNEISFPFLRKTPNGVQEIQNIINNDTNNNAKEKAKLIYHIVNKELNPSTFSGKMSLFLNSLFRKIFRKKDVNAFYKKCQEKTKPYADTIDDTIKEKHSDDTYRVDFDKKDQDYDFNQNLVVSNISSSYIGNKPNFFKHTTNCNDTNNKEEKQNLTKTRGNKI